MIDSAAKRFSMMELGSVTGFLIPPDGVIDAADRATLLQLYATECIHVERSPTLVDHVSPVHDVVRGILQDIGTRPYRTYLVTETWSGAVIGEGTVTRTFEEILPSPRVRGSGAWSMEAGGQRLVGSMTADKISRIDYTREALKGLRDLPSAARRPLNEAFRIGLQPRYQAHMQLYVPGEPKHEKYGWTLRLEPTSHRIAFDPTAIAQDTMADVADTAVRTAREIQTETGLREWRVYRIREIWSGTHIGEGTVQYQQTELQPAPRIRFVSETEEMLAGGRRLTGDAVLDRFMRVETVEAIKGEPSSGARAPLNEAFHYGIEARHPTARVIELYKVGAEPTLGTFGWELTIKPEGRRIAPC